MPREDEDEVMQEEQQPAEGRTQQEQKTIEEAKEAKNAATQEKQEVARNSTDEKADEVQEDNMLSTRNLLEDYEQYLASRDEALQQA